MAKQPSKWTFLRNNIVTLLRHDFFFHMIHCAYTFSMFVINLIKSVEKHGHSD